MEMFAKIEVQGIVGRVEKHQMTKDKELCFFSVLVETVFKNKDGETIIDTQWFSCQGVDLDIKKGDAVHLVGGVRMIRHIPGEDERIIQVLVEKIEKI